MISWHDVLEHGYWISQIILVIVAAVAALVTYYQFQTSKLFELLKYLEAPHIRTARNMIFHKLKATTNNEWWNGDTDLEQAAAAVCAAFSILGHLAKGRVRRRFVRDWAYVICWTYESLQPYLINRRKDVPNAYDGYPQLYVEAKLHDPRLRGTF